MRQHPRPAAVPIVPTFQGEPPTLRVLACPALKQRIDAQGRRLDWIAARIGVSKSLVSKIVSGQSTLSLADARVIAALIDAHVAELFAPLDQEHQQEAEA